jgi:hypothetical protein
MHLNITPIPSESTSYSVPYQSEPERAKGHLLIKGKEKISCPTTSGLVWKAKIAKSTFLVDDSGGLRDVFQFFLTTMFSAGKP